MLAGIIGVFVISRTQETVHSGQLQKPFRRLKIGGRIEINQIPGMEQQETVPFRVKERIQK